jgi:hypothetical protein
MAEPMSNHPKYRQIQEQFRYKPPSRPHWNTTGPEDWNPDDFTPDLRSVDADDPPARKPGERNTPERLARAKRIRLARLDIEDTRTGAQREAQLHSRYVARSVPAMVAAWLASPNIVAISRQFGVTVGEAKGAIWGATTKRQRYRVIRALRTRQQAQRDKARRLALGVTIKPRKAAIPVVWKGKPYPSINAAAKATGIPHQTLWKRFVCGSIPREVDKLATA